MSQKINLTKHIIAVSLLLFSAIAFVSCEKNIVDPPKEITAKVSFQNEIIPIFTGKCATTGCHVSGSSFDLSASKAYITVTTGNHINLNDPANSEIITKQYEGGHGQKCTDEEINLIIAWIKQGAKENDEPTK